MPLKKISTPNVMFVVFGLPVSIPQGWIKEETMSVTNSIQQDNNPQYVPPINLSEARYTIRVSVPMVSSFYLHTARLLKSSLKSISVSLAAERYEGLDYENGINPEQIGFITIPIGDNLDIEAPGFLAMICGYYGVNMHFSGGYLQNFSTTFDPNTRVENWTIVFQEKIVATIRKGPPDPEKIPETLDSPLINRGNTELLGIATT